MDRAGVEDRRDPHFREGRQGAVALECPGKALDASQPVLGVKHPLLPTRVGPFGLGVQFAVIAVDVVIGQTENFVWSGLGACGDMVGRTLDARDFTGSCPAKKREEGADRFCLRDPAQEVAKRAGVIAGHPRGIGSRKAKEILAYVRGGRLVERECPVGRHRGDHSEKSSDPQ